MNTLFLYHCYIIYFIVICSTLTCVSSRTVFGLLLGVPLTVGWLVPSCFFFGRDRYVCEVMFRHVDRGRRLLCFESRYEKCCLLFFPQPEGTGIRYQARKAGYNNYLKTNKLISETLRLQVVFILETSGFSYGGRAQFIPSPQEEPPALKQVFVLTKLCNDIVIW